MPILKDWIFVHIPRTGGTYIESLFDLQWEADSEKEDNEENRKKLFGLYRHKGILFTLQHLTSSEIEQHFSEYSGLKKFTIVRNPYHRAISLWIHHKANFPDFCFCEFLYLLYKKKVFEYNHNGRVSGDCVERIKYHFIPQQFYTHDTANRQRVDVICHYESDDIKTFINNEFNLKAEFNPPKTEEYYKPFLGDTEVQLINKIYERDFAIFKYEKK